MNLLKEVRLRWLHTHLVDITWNTNEGALLLPTAFQFPSRGVVIRTCQGTDTVLLAWTAFRCASLGKRHAGSDEKVLLDAADSHVVFDISRTLYDGVNATGTYKAIELELECPGRLLDGLASFPGRNGRLCRLRLSGKYDEITHAVSLGLEFGFYTDRPIWATSGMDAEAVHIHAVMISVPLQHSLESKPTAAQPVRGCDWEALLDALRRLPELQSLLLLFQTYHDLEQFDPEYRGKLGNLQDLVKLLFWDVASAKWKVADPKAVENSTGVPL